MVVKRTWTVENKWRCDSCGSENLGRFTECQNCRNPKEKQEKDVVPDPATAPVVTDPELLRLANQGPNWVCEFCGGQVRNEHGKCVRSCGAPRPQPDPSPAPAEAPERLPEAPRAVPRPPPTGVPGPGRVKDRPVPRFRRALTLGGGLAGVAGVVALLVFLLVPWEVNATVQSIRWDYRADLRQRVTLHDTGWGSPSGAFNVSCKRKFYGTESCNPHNCNPHSVSYECNCTSYECNCSTTCSDNGNGFSTCSESCSTCQSCSTCSRTEYDTCYDQCDVYKDWCEYDYYEWPVIQTKETFGVVHDEHWPDLSADGPLQRLDRAERYEVRFVDRKEEWTYRPKSLDDFKKFNTAATWKIRVNRVRSVIPLQPFQGTP